MNWKIYHSEGRRRRLSLVAGNQALGQAGKCIVCIYNKGLVTLS